MSLKEVIKLAKQLSTVDKVRLIHQIAPKIERELTDKLDLLQKSQMRGTSRLELGSIDDLRRSKEPKAGRL